jgi:hypothetical protein
MIGGHHPYVIIWRPGAIALKLNYLPQHINSKDWKTFPLIYAKMLTNQLFFSVPKSPTTVPIVTILLYEFFNFIV